ncbi:MAG: hypothetical protein HZA58_04095 [Acidimicrobiia bacterium]|nr:hypothetical protein [Acidimicrobiia bacterium]
MTVDGRRQRRALSAAEQALAALEAGDAPAARRAAHEAASLDQIGAFAAFAPAVDRAAAALDSTGVVDDASWEGVADALEAGPLRSRARRGRP